MAAGVPEKSIFRTDQSQGTRIENVTLGFAKRMYRNRVPHFRSSFQRYTYRVLQTIQMKLILLCVWAEPAVLGRAGRYWQH